REHLKPRREELTDLDHQPAEIDGEHVRALRDAGQAGGGPTGGDAREPKPPEYELEPPDLRQVAHCHAPAAAVARRASPADVAWARSMPAFGSGPRPSGSRGALDSHGAARPAVAATSASPASVSEYVFRPSATSETMSPSSARSCRVG